MSGSPSVITGMTYSGGTEGGRGKKKPPSAKKSGRGKPKDHSGDASAQAAKAVGGEAHVSEQAKPAPAATPAPKTDVWAWQPPRVWVCPRCGQEVETTEPGVRCPKCLLVEGS